MSPHGIFFLFLVKLYFKHDKQQKELKQSILMNLTTTRSWLGFLSITTALKYLQRPLVLELSIYIQHFRRQYNIHIILEFSKIVYVNKIFLFPNRFAGVYDELLSPPRRSVEPPFGARYDCKRLTSRLAWPSVYENMVVRYEFADRIEPPAMCFWHVIRTSP